MAVCGKHYQGCEHTGCQSPVIYALPKSKPVVCARKKPFKVS